METRKLGIKKAANKDHPSLLAATFCNGRILS